MKSQMCVSLAGLRTLVAAALLFFVATIQSALPASFSELLEKGIYTEETKGDLDAAIQVYQQIARDPAADRNVAAQAQLRLGLCYLKLGDKTKAVAALNRLTQDFPDKQKLLSIMERQMPLLLDEIIRQVEQNYIKEVDRSELMETAIRAIVGKLDKESDFFGEKELAEVNQQLDQKIAGVGAVLKVDSETHEVMVETPLPGSPALKGGIRAGDRILEINGEATADVVGAKGLAAVVKMIQGRPGEPVTMGVRRSGSDDIQQITVVRDIVRLPSVIGDHYKPDQTWEFMLDEEKKIGYIRLTEVGRQSAAEMKTALTELTNRGVRAFVLDLRNNPGGIMDGATAIADLFVDSGTIVTIKGRTGVEQVITAKTEDTFPAFPIALLVNKQTASAAEVIAACLQDHQRAVVIGERTFGQGIVRQLIQLNGGKNALKLPTAAYYRPSGKSMHRYPESTDSDDWGVRPDDGYEVTFSEQELKDFYEYRKQRAIVNAPRLTTFRDRGLEKALEYLG